jgi:hypothetical protein
MPHQNVAVRQVSPRSNDLMTENMKDSKHQDERHAMTLAVGFSCHVMKDEEIEPVPTSTYELLFRENSQTSANTVTFSKK